MFGIIINKEGYKIAFDTLENLKNKIKDEEQIIETNWNIANTMSKPKWDGEKWVETGTPEPIPPPEQIIDPKDILIAELSISLAETQTQGTQAIAELTEAIAMLQIPTV